MICFLFFLFGKTLKIFSGSNFLFRGLTFLLVESISFGKRNANSIIECKNHEKRDRLLVSKIVTKLTFNFQIS